MPPVVQILDVSDYDEQVRRGADVLRDGGVVVLPTETVYGAAAVLSREEARRRLGAIRAGSGGAGSAGRGAGSEKPFIVHLPDSRVADRYIGEVSDLGRRMIRKLWPGPVALVFDVPEPRRTEVAASLNVPASDLYDVEGGTITLRCPDHLLTSDVLARVPNPVALTLVSTSPSATGAPARWEQLDAKVDLVFDAGPTRYSKPSTIVHVKGPRYQIVREGIYDQRIIERLLRTTVLFVCSGNTCRSPMAEALARKILARRLKVHEEELENRGINVASAGSLAMPGARATPQAVEALRQLDADLSRHRSRPLSVELIHQADVIFTMSRAHAQGVVALVPSAADKTFALDSDADIEDPIGGDQALYLELARKLEGLIERRLEEKQLV